MKTTLCIADLRVASFDTAPRMEAGAREAINTYQAGCHPIQTQPPVCP